MKPVIFPEPAVMEEKSGFFNAPIELAKVLENPSTDFENFSKDLDKYHVSLSINGGKRDLERIGNEGYALSISKDEIQITANTNTGCFHGTQTLRWLIPPALKSEESPENKMVQVPCLEILDYPRYVHRGFMLDEARYFLGIDAVKSVLDWMALLKLNTFHWHLTEDQGWRIEIIKYPKLTEIGSKRDGTPIFRNGKPPAGQENNDHVPHQGYYTQDQIKEIIEHASARHITIIPEIEMPGHATAALASYPELRCSLPDDIPEDGANIFGQFLDGPNIKVSTRWGVHANLFCASNPKTITFIKDVLKEVADLFPGPIIHIGGDEVPKTQWLCCERCQEKIETLGLNSEEDLQKLFTADMIDYLATLNKKTMLWNEHTDESLASRKDNVICQYWTGPLEKISGFLEKGGKVVMSPSRFVYLDLAYHTLPLKKVYQYTPLNEETASKLSQTAIENAKNGCILGIEAPMWGEVFKSKEQMEYCTFPRILAISDLAWSPEDKKDHPSFLQRASIALKRLETMNINHATLEDADPSKEAIEKASKNPKFGHYAYFD
ncbi:MAG: beta-N-acetylhexosaminidase [Promethearchaeota archaeon]